MGLNQYPGNVITANKTSPTVESASGVWTIEEANQNIRNWPMPLTTVYDSLKFNSADSASLSRTPTTASNRRTWTFSAWIKRCEISTTERVFFSAGVDGNNFTALEWINDSLYLQNYTSGVQTITNTTAVFRDPSAWYHVVFAIDTTQTTAANRAIVYVNGVQQAGFSGSPFSLNQQFWINYTYSHRIGARQLSSADAFSNQYMTEVNFIDGLALDADYFGFFDANGIWQPRAYKGAYGTNGFYLPMRESATASGFSTVTYTGTGSTNNVTGVGFAPDLVWIKVRNDAQNHRLFDIVRGANKRLMSSSTAAEATTTDELSAFGNDGFTLGANTDVNGSAYNYVGWCWDAGSSTVTNNDGTITGAQVRANPTYGFSVVTASASGTSPVTVGHGLGSAPSMIIGRVRNNTANWYVYHSSIAASDYLVLNSTDAKATSSNIWDTAPTSTVFTIGNPQNGWNGGTAGSYNYVAYCFSEIAGYSKFGSYTGTGASGNTVTTGFKPAFLLIKRIDTGGNNWGMYDSTRNNPNYVNYELLASSSAAESSLFGTFRFTDTGFTILSTNGGENASGGTYIYMAFADTRAYSAFDDYSGNGNNWQPNNIGTDDVYVDVPTNWGTDTGVGGEVRGNYATWNPLYKPVNVGTAFTYTNGNLTTQGNDAGVPATIGVSSGKWYWEVTCFNYTGVMRAAPGIVSKTAVDKGATYDSTTASGYDGFGGPAYGYYNSDGNKFNVGTSASYGASWTEGDIIGIAFDADNWTLTFYKNGVSQGTAFTGITPDTYFPLYWTAYINKCTANFGATPFSYTAPSGFKALCTTNLPEPTIADGSDYMNAVLWTGNGSTQSISTGFAPGLVWNKSRSNADFHNVFDSVRGGIARLVTNSTNAEATTGNGFAGITSTGFDLDNSGGGGDNNASGRTYVGWAWKANGAGVLNEVGTIDSTVSANTTAGFSIAAYTSDGASTQTFGHGLGVTPAFVIIKARDRAGERWPVWHQSLSTNGFVALNETSAVSTASTVFQTASITNSVIAIGNNASVGNSGTSYICYAFTPIAGYSAFGSYTGNGSSNGTFVYTGFRPRYLLIKVTNLAGYYWNVHDTARNPYNSANLALYPNTSNADDAYAAGSGLDILSNGFKIRDAGGGLNANGSTYIYAAFAENPFKLSRAR